MSHAHVTAGDAAIPAVGYGTWPLKDEDCARGVATALASGYRHVDTAASYDNEAAVAEGLRVSKVPREQVWITTKVWWDSVADGALQRSAEASLERLGIDQVDLLLIHWPSKTVPLSESIRALNDAKRRGLTRHIGVSNFPSRMLEEAVSLSGEPILVNQCEYHPHLDQSKVLAACKRHGVAVIAYCPLGRGSVGGVLQEPVVQEIAERVGRTPAQVVLRWHVQQRIVPVPKSTNPQRIAENLDIFGFELDEADMRRLSGLARPDGRIVDLPFAPEWD